MTTWAQASGAIALAAALVLLPGIAVLAATFRWSPRVFLLAPALSASILAASAVAAPLVGLRWSLLPVAAATAVAAGAGYALRHGAWRDLGDSFARASWWAAALGVAVGAVLIGARLQQVFIGPDHISQTFDNIAHLNSVQWTLDHGSASAFDISAVTGAPFYPNGWNALASLVAVLSGVSTPTAVTATNLVVGALVWPTSCLALAAVVFRGSSAALLVSGVLSGAFGAFPILLFDFGVLYPNAYGYALLPGVIACAIDALGVIEPDRLRSHAELWRSSILLLVLWVGLGLAHPNAFLASIALTALLLLPWVVQRVRRAQTERQKARYRITVYIAAGAFVALWLLARTPLELSRWGPWQGPLAALRDGLLGTPGSASVTWTVSGLVLVGLVVSFRRARGWLVLLPFSMALLLFVLAAGTHFNLLREAATNPWNNDPFRLAALLPTAAVPTATAGALAVARAGAWVLRRVRAPALVGTAFAVLGLAGLALASQGPNVRDEAARARTMYVMDENSPLLTFDEWNLIERLPTTTPPDALIAGNPRTGTSLAYALATRQVVEPHIFGQQSEDVQFLDRSLRDIETDPRVCKAVERVGVDYVLDFGRNDVHNAQGSYDAYDGIQELSATRHLVLVDSEGDRARLFRIEGC